MDAIEMAKRSEILEGMLEAAFQHDIVTFDVFKSVWITIDNTTEFSGPPRPYVAEGYCPHCDHSWTIEGVSFNDEHPTNERDCVSIHCSSNCYSQPPCHCFDLDDPTLESCQICFHAFRDCSCAEPTPGPCADPLVTLRWFG